MDPRQQKIERDLGPLLAGDLRTDPIALALFSTAACIFRRKPLAVVSPRNESDVARVVEYAASAGVPVTARGGGSSLAGQALGPGIILDFAAHMHRVVDVDADRRTVRVEPGAIHTRVQKAARGVGLRLGPDPSSGDFCTIGGNVGTNASGAHTLRHGSTKDHVLGMTVVLHDGSVARLGTHAGSGGEGTTWHKLSSELTHILREGAPAFLPERPRSNKNSCGFDLWGAWAPGDQVSSIEPRFDPMRLIVGSEGTLGIVTDVTMRLVPKPKATAVALLYFASWEDATEAVLEARRLGASAIEAMDHTFLAFVRADRADLRPLIPERFDSSILVEFEGETAEEARAGIAAVEEWAAARRGKVLDFRAARNAAEQATLWAVRKAALPLIYRASPIEKPMNFIDDTAVPAERLGDYVNGLRAMFQKHRTRFAIFGHAGNGNVHVMPLLDPHDGTFQSRMAAMAEDAFELTWSLGGTITGEHGDGILRAPYLERQYPKAYAVMARVKHAMDPTGILNPGNVISDARTFPEGFSRYTNTYVETGTVFDEPEYRDMIEMCHGCGTCRDYCPVGSTTALEPHTARAKAVLLMEMIRGDLSRDSLTEKPLKEVMDSCFNCKMCLSECPSQVDIPGLAIAARKEFVEKHGMPVRNWILGHADKVAAVAGLAPAAVNLVVGSPLERAARESVGKVAGKLDLPRFRRPFATGGASAKRALSLPLEAGPRKGVAVAAAHPHARLGPMPHRDVPLTKRVAYFAGCFARFHDPQGEAEATVKVLEANGIEVVVPEQRCCGIALITMGAERSIRADARRNLETLLPLVDRGFTVVASAPSCGLALIEDYPRILGTEEARHLAAHTIDVHQYLWRLHERGELRTDFKEVPISVVYHNACHSVAQGITEEPIKLLKLVPGVEVRPIDDSCCGIAGTYGMKSENYERAMEIGAPLFKELHRTKAEAILTGCGTCNIQIAHGAKREVVHTMAILRRAYGV
ncbi:MAG: anaerobic glycerol-3-phosphate dehydrogenase subunit C [Candidatus Eisenbacteria bacterium]|uniref:Anaerobic glycerol-3-phosphate dehydrogenase subunit C n=1 Tax=Eiseniibacteriota bacterium TaxID=2212470 RepID=A0A538SDY7_UNCEI|nr:MAG: anaerobic glycerol-3-phosphate dehydrogenase subunit C [Candidatus Eisenbacteria bacterium]